VIFLSGRLICTDEQEAETVHHHLPDHLCLTRAEPGCLRFDITATTDPLIWRVDESFVDQAAFDAHQTRTKASPWFAATGQIRRDFKLTTASDHGQKTDAPTGQPRPE
jgi:quinol monooxygenase YgiN